MNTKINCDCQLARRLRGFIPAPRSEYRKLIIVELEAGAEIRAHEHLGHTALYYPMDSDAIVLEPKAGTVIYVPPGCRHWVPPVDRGRISFAMVVDPPDKN